MGQAPSRETRAHSFAIEGGPPGSGVKQKNRTRNCVRSPEVFVSQAVTWTAWCSRLVARAIAGARRTLLLEALTAVDRLARGRLEGDFRLLPAVRARRGVH